MDIKVTFNATVCIIGILIFLIHSVNLLIRKDRRVDENILLSFFVFTIFHFATYLTFSLIRINYTSDAFIKTFYTLFYIMNNIEVFFLFVYMKYYVEINKKSLRIANYIFYTLFFTFIILDIVNAFTGIFFTSVNGVYTRNKLMFIYQGFQVVAFGMVFYFALTSKKLNTREKLAFTLYCLMPLISIILQNIFPGFAIAYLGIIISIEILFTLLTIEKNVKIAKIEEQNKEAQIKLMVSQIRPHFIYNTLSSISTLIPVDPQKAQEALDGFTEYLRTNFSTLTDNRLVSFEDELKHIKTYVSLEKMRFNDRLNVIYDIGVSNFEVPPLSIQPLVENAIKHGILQKIEGGTIILKTYEDSSAYIVEVKDDGVGFDINKVDFTHNEHIGLNNIKHRLNTMTKGELTIDSEINKGTLVVVKFYK